MIFFSFLTNNRENMHIMANYKYFAFSIRLAEVFCKCGRARLIYIFFCVALSTLRKDIYYQGLKSVHGNTLGTKGL